MNVRIFSRRGLVAMVCSAALIVSGTATAVPASASDLTSERGLSARLGDILEGTYKSLADRTEPSGFAATSLTGEYDGMFYRDSSIQANAMLATGDDAGARGVLQYLLGYAADKDLSRAPRKLPYESHIVSATYPLEKGDSTKPVSAYEEIDGSTALLKLNGPSNGGALSFVAGSSPITQVDLGLLSLTDGPGSVTVAIRQSRDYNQEPIAEIVANSADFYTSNGRPVWASFAFDQSVQLTQGVTYYITMRASNEPDAIVQLWGSQSGGSGSVRTWNFSSGNWENNPTITRGLYRIFTEQGLIVSSTQEQDESGQTLLQIQRPNHQAAQPFTLMDDHLSNVWLPVSGGYSAGSLNVSVRTDREDAATEVASGRTEFADLNALRRWINVPLETTPGATVQAGTDYWLVISADVISGQDRVIIWGTTGGARHLGGSWNFDQDVHGGWKTETHRLGFLINTEHRAQLGPAYKQDLQGVVGTTGGAQAHSFTFESGTPVTAFDVHLGKTEDVSGDVTVTISDSMGREQVAHIPASEISFEGSWHRVIFAALGRGGDGTFSVGVAAPQSPANTIQVFGKSGATGYQALSLVTSGEQMSDQPDGNYMVIDAWARYVKAVPEDTPFVADTYEVISRWADYYLTPNYLDTTLQLIRNPELEHSRRHYHFTAYDLMTNVFASQALHELAQIAQDMPGQEAKVATWQDRAQWLEQGIKNNLVTEVQIGGEERTIYGELFWEPGQDYQTRTFIPGYSWVNFAPVAADWYAIDWDVMENTYDAYLEHGSIEWTNDQDDQKDLMLLMDTEENTWEPLDPPNVWHYERYAVIGKGLGWELMTASELNRQGRLDTIEHFLDVQTPGNILGEFYYKQGPSDVGNQEQGAWWILGMLAAYPKRIASATPTIRGEVKVGATLTAVPGDWDEAATLSYAWYADDTLIEGQSSVVLVIGEALVGKEIKVQVTGTKEGYDSVTATSAATIPVPPLPDGPDGPDDPDNSGAPHPVQIGAITPTIAGKIRVGQKLTAKTGQWTPASASLAYQWYANGVAVKNANKATLKLGARLVGKRLSVRVTGTLSGSTTQTRLSTATKPVAKGRLDAKKVKIRGKAVVSKKLTATTKVWKPGKVKLTYRWFVGGKRIKGATKKRLVVKRSFAGKRVKVRAIGKKAGYGKVVKTSKTKRVRR